MRADLPPDTRCLLTGLFVGRGSVYVGHSGRLGGGDRFSVGVQVEVPERFSLLDEVFGEPKIRVYFGSREVFRYGSQRRDDVLWFASQVSPRLMPPLMRGRLEAVTAFCEDPSQRAYERYVEGLGS